LNSEKHIYIFNLKGWGVGGIKGEILVSLYSAI
jgi:hypothetical protein